MTQKVAVITGASKGIGRKTAIRLAEIGYNVVLIARSMKNLAALAKVIETKTTTSHAFCYQCDLTELENIKTVISHIIDKHKRIDVLVNAAGIYEGGTLDLPIDDYQRLFDINVKAIVMLTKLIIPIMKKNKKGYLFNIASRAGKIGFAERGGYVASKFAVVGLSESLHRELANYNIKVTSICPGYVNTEMARKAGSDLKGGEMIQTKDIAEIIVCLLSLSASAYIKSIEIECQCFADM
ncbi:MAG: SDR family oxidoreductase [Gammaproteobacteria bacterium]|jgi:short-subunit dehydrogenase